MSTLLEQVEKVKTKSGSNRAKNPIDVDVAIAWADGRVRLVQIQKVLGDSARFSIYIQLATALRDAVRSGKLVKA